MPWTHFQDPAHLLTLASPSRSRCEGFIKLFEESWRLGDSPAIARYLGSETAPNRRALLIELIHIDMEFRLKRGESARVEAYLAEFPELVDDRSAVLGLAVAEYELRRRGEEVHL